MRLSANEQSQNVLDEPFLCSFILLFKVDRNTGQGSHPDVMEWEAEVNFLMILWRASLRRGLPTSGFLLSEGDELCLVKATSILGICCFKEPSIIPLDSSVNL